MTLVARDLTCRRGALSLFEPASFTLAPGEALMLRGPNGAGKTTLLRAIAGLGPSPGGNIELDGTPLAACDGAVAMSGHLDAVKAALTVRENISFWAALHGRGDIGAALAAFDLDALADRLAGRLSAGQKRRLGLARLMVSGAPVWLLDEPTVSLDTQSTEALGRILADHLAQDGYAIIATHLPLPVEARTLILGPAAAADSVESDPFLSEAAG